MSKPKTEAAPHSWDVAEWPAHVWPNDADRARWIVRAYRDQLLYHHALTRVGKRLVVLGAGWTRFLSVRADDVKRYNSNNPDCGRAAAKRVAPPLGEAA
jgi:hypothetical protein